MSRPTDRLALFIVGFAAMLGALLPGAVSCVLFLLAPAGFVVFHMRRRRRLRQAEGS